MKGGPTIGLLLLATVTTLACDRGEPGALPPPAEPVEVTVSAAIRGSALIFHPATVVSTDEIELATRASGTVRRIRVDVGSRVAGGDTLVEIDASDVDARIESAAARLRRARRYFDRIESLHGDGAATEQELDDARAELRQAEAGLGEARARREYVALRAPFAATVTGRSADPGDLAVPGRPVLALVRPEALEVVADLPGEAGRSVSEGDRFRIRDPETGVARNVRVIRVSPARDRASRRIRVELGFTEEPASGAAAGAGRGAGLVPGSYVRLEREEPRLSTVWIPADAVIGRGQLSGVYVVRRDSLDLRWVRTGVHRGGATEVLAGIEPGDRVVRRPGADFTDGSPVGTVRRSPWEPGSGRNPAPAREAVAGDAGR